MAFAQAARAALLEGERMPELNRVALESIEGVEMPGHRQIWERLPGESARAWSAFQKFRDAQNRTLSSVGEALTPPCSKQNVGRWSYRWRWQERVAAFDVHEDQVHREEMARARTEMDRRQMKLGIMMQSLGAHALAELQRRVEQKLSLDLSPSEARDLIAEGARLERAAHGEREDGRYTQVIVNLGDSEAIGDEKVTPAFFDGATPFD
jgi:hypothetical protein